MKKGRTKREGGVGGRILEDWSLIGQTRCVIRGGLLVIGPLLLRRTFPEKKDSEHCRHTLGPEIFRRRGNEELLRKGKGSMALPLKGNWTQTLKRKGVLSRQTKKTVRTATFQEEGELH